MFARILSSLLASVAIATQAAAPNQWEWVQPTPHRQNWVDLASGPNGFVGLTDGFGGRTIYHSPDGNAWQQATVPPLEPYLLRQVVYANGHYVAVGGHETIVTSTDGLDWQLRNTNSAGSLLFDVAYGNGAYVAVGYNSVALFSKDLKAWYPLDFVKGSSLLNIEFGNGMFLAVSSAGTIFKSTDGRIWTPLPWPAGYPVDIGSSLESGFAFSKGVFVLSQRSGTISTTDGVNWTGGAGTFYRKIVSTDDGFIASSNDSLAVSADGMTWEPRVSIPNISGVLFSAIGKLNQRRVAGGANGLLYASNDGETWNAVVNPVDYSHSKIAQANGKFIRYGTEAGQWVSTDGASWTWNANGPALSALAGGNGTWVGIDEENKAAMSRDGLFWIPTELPAQPYGDVVFGKGNFICAAQGGVLSSTDGQQWTLSAVANVSSIRLVGFQNGMFAAFSNNSEPMTSADGRTWTVGAARPDLRAQFYTAGNGRFVGIGGGGMGPGSVVWSTDGVNWQREILSSGSTFGYTGLAYGGGYFVMIDGSGSIFSSADAITWTGGQQAAQPFTGAAFGNGVWVVVGGDSVLRSSDRVTAKSTATLQLAKGDSTTWSLIVTGAAGERWVIQASAGVGAAWDTLQTVEIPAAGRITVPLATEKPGAFFRAVTQP